MSTTLPYFYVFHFHGRFLNVILQRADDGAWRVSEFDPSRVEGELQRLLRGEAARPHGDVILCGEAA